MAQESTGKRKLIVDCDDETMRCLAALSGAAERSNAWIVRRLIATSTLRVFPRFAADEASFTPPDINALRELGLLGMEAQSGSGEL